MIRVAYSTLLGRVSFHCLSFQRDAICVLSAMEHFLYLNCHLSLRSVFLFKFSLNATCSDLLVWAIEAPSARLSRLLKKKIALQTGRKVPSHLSYLVHWSASVRNLRNFTSVQAWLSIHISGLGVSFLSFIVFVYCIASGNQYVI
jgi:hypothetical protein